jgi:hypothetical protein
MTQKRAVPGSSFLSSSVIAMKVQMPKGIAKCVRQRTGLSVAVFLESVKVVLP